jgi:hypothetical protein
LVRLPVFADFLFADFFFWTSTIVSRFGIHVTVIGHRDCGFGCGKAHRLRGPGRSGDSRFLASLGMTILQLLGAGFAEGFQDYYGADGEGDYGGESSHEHQGWVEVEDVGEDGGYGEGYSEGVQADWSAGGGSLRGRGLGVGAEVGTKIGAEAALQQEGGDSDGGYYY